VVAHEARYRYRLRVSPKEALALRGVFDSCKFVWNQALGRWGDLWRHEHLLLSYKDMDAELTDWRGRFEWLAASPSVPQQQVLRDLSRSISAFFDKSNPASRPTYKRRRDLFATARWSKNGFRVAGTGLGLKRPGGPADRLEIAVAGGRLALRVVWSRPLPCEPTSVTIKRDALGNYWASFVVRIEVPSSPISPTGGCSGLDLGLSTFATTEDPSSDIPNPRFARAAAKALARSQRSFASKQMGSANRAKAKRRVARVAARTANQRADFAHKAARALLASYDTIGVEELAVKNMMASSKRMPEKKRFRQMRRCKAGLNRSIADAAWSQFRSVLEWQATKAGKDIVAVPAKDTTQRCSCCGTKAKPRIELSDRVFRCRACGLVLGRDRNSARNLNPLRIGALAGGSEPVDAAVPEGADGKKTKIPAGTLAA
jgi:putative transposase